MEDTTEVTLDGKLYIWDGDGWLEARTFMIPPDTVLARLHEIRRKPGTQMARPMRARSARGFTPVQNIRPEQPPPPPPQAIDSFEGEFAILANDAPATVFLNGEQFPSVSAAFEQTHQRHLQRKPGSWREWEAIQLEIMRRCLRSKFSAPALRATLLATGNRPLVNAGASADPFWGQPGGSGENKLGILLMQLRDQLAMHHCILPADLVVEQLREYSPQNRLIGDESLTRPCCWNKITELAEFHRDEIPAEAWRAICEEQQRLSAGR